MQTLTKLAVALVLVATSAVGHAQVLATNPPNETAVLALAQKGDVEAEYSLGMLYSKQGTGTQQDFPKALPWFLKAADHNHPHANLILGQLYSVGQGVPKNEGESAKRNKRAEELYRAAANKGDVKAQVRLGDMYERGWGVTKDLNAALGWYTKAASNGSAEAKSSIGCIFLSQQDFEKAAYWLRLGAEAGDLKAQSNLGNMYLKGVGLPKDTVEGMKWIRFAAEKGDPTAQNNLGVCYRDGVGVEKAQKKADEWFAKAKASHPQM